MVTINGNNSDNWYDLSSSPATTNSADTVHGNGGDDYIYGAGGNDKLYGDDGNDYLEGGPGSDKLFGGDGDDILVDYHGGRDEMRGGAGNDRYTVSSAGDVIIETAGGGDDDSVYVAGLQVYTMPDYVETLYVHNEGFSDMTGNAGNNFMYNWYGDAILRGLGGDDQLWGSYSNDTLHGGNGRDILNADGGTNTLNGGEEGDILIGGEETDYFVFGKLSHSAPGKQNGKPNFDQIRGNGGEHVFDDGDKIDVSGIDANSTVSGNQAFVWGGEISLAATGARGSIYVAERNGDTVVVANTDSDSAWDFLVEIEDGQRTAGWYIESDVIL